MSQPVHTTESVAMTAAERAAAVAAAKGGTRKAVPKPPPRKRAAGTATVVEQSLPEAMQLQVAHHVLKDSRLPGVEVTIEFITPELAELYLSRLPTATADIKQRNLSPKTVDRYAGDMLGEQWPFTGDPVRFNTHGELIDGQHRLKAIVLSGTTQPCIVIRGLDPETFVVFDTGRARSLGDALKSMGVANTTMVAGVTRRMFYWRRGGYGVQFVPRVPNPAFLGTPASPGKLIETFHAYKSEIQGAARRGAAFKQTGFAPKTAAPSVVGFLFILFKKIDPQRCEQFFHELQVGPAQVGPEYPIAALRKRLFQHVSTAEQASPDWVWMHFFIHVWNKWCAGESIGSGSLKTPPHATYGYIAKPFDPYAADRPAGWEPIPLMKLDDLEGGYA